MRSLSGDLFALLLAAVLVLAACAPPLDPVVVCREGAAAAVHELAEERELDSVTVAALDSSADEVCASADEALTGIEECSEEQAIEQWRGWFAEVWGGGEPPQLGC